MKRTFLSLLTIALLSATAFAQDTQDAAEGAHKFAEHVDDVDSIIEALYASISGEVGEPRQWDLFEYIMAPDARLIPTMENEDGTNGYMVWSPQDYKERANDWLVTNGFYEYETNRVQEDYGRVVHLFSTYGSKRSINDAEPFAYGINSIQLFHDGKKPSK